MLVYLAKEAFAAYTRPVPLLVLAVLSLMYVYGSFKVHDLLNSLILVNSLPDSYYGGNGWTIYPPLSAVPSPSKLGVLEILSRADVFLRLSSCLAAMSAAFAVTRVISLRRRG
jgi:heme/copper-type cytochrome/quinol oxidase subunit 1